jgi:large conductance mechanosensitive channel
MFKEFKEFAMRGNVMDMAVGIILGAAFGAVVKALVDKVIMPPVGLFLGGADFSSLFVVLKHGAPAGPYATLAEAAKAGAVTLGYGEFINTIVSFVIVAFAVFLLVKGMNRMQREEQAAPAEPTAKDCPFCLMSIPLDAVKCGHCTANLSE